MRFRLGLNGGGEQMFDGVSRGFANLGMLPVYQAQAAEQFADGEAKRALTGAQIRQSDAHAALYGQQAEESRQQLAHGSLPEMIRTAALVNKVAPSQIPEVSDFVQTGKLPSMYTPGPGDMGPVAPAPDYADMTGTGGQILRTLGLMRGGLAAGDKNIDNVAQAQGRLQKQDIITTTSRDPSQAGRFGQAVAASEGKPLIDNIGDTGRGFNQFTGQGGTLEAGLSALYDQGQNAEIGQRNAATGASKASAVNSYASADQHRASTGKINLETQQLRDGQGKGSMASPKDKFEAENKLRDEFQKQTGTFGTVRDAYAKVQAAATNPNAASDIALIFAYMKILDPTSVVREGEFATAQNAGSIPDRIRNMYNKAVDGTRLNDVQRTNFIGEAKKVYKAQETGLRQTEKNYTDLATRYGLNVQNIVAPFAPVEEAKPRAGGVVDFNALGGNAAPATPAKPPKVVDYGGLK